MDGLSFGRRVALSDDGLYLVIGMPSKVSVFVRSGTNTWTQQAALSGGTEKFGRDGLSINSDGKYVAAGDVSSLSTKGSVYVFVRSGVTWSQQDILVCQESGPAAQGRYARTRSGPSSGIRGASTRARRPDCGGARCG